MANRTSEAVKLIELTKGMFAIVDEQDFESTEDVSWHYSICSEFGYAKNGNRGYLHRWLTKAPKGKEVDHINHDTLDCRRSNLRICDRSQNTFNHPKRKTNKSGHVGVWQSKDGRWHAEIMRNYKKIQLGSSMDKEKVITLRKEAEQEVFEDFKRHDETL